MTKPARRRGSRGAKRRRDRRCIREGCTRDARAEHAACCFLCSVVAQELERAQRLCQAIGGDTEHWLAAVTLNDALTEYYRSDGRIYRAALSVGITEDQWHVIKRGD